MKLGDIVTTDEFCTLCCPEFGSCVRFENEEGYDEEYELCEQFLGYTHFLKWFGRNVGDEQLVAIAEKLRLLSAEERWFLSEALDHFEEKTEEEVLRDFDTWQPEGVFDPALQRRIIRDVDLRHMDIDFTEID